LPHPAADVAAVAGIISPLVDWVGQVVARSPKMSV